MNERVSSMLCGAALAFGLAFGGVACGVTALDLTCSLGALAVCLMLLCLLFAGLLSVPRGGYVLLGLAAVAVIWAAFNQSFHEEALSMAAQIGHFYKNAYGLVLPEAIEEVTKESHLVPVLVMSAVIAATVCWAAVHRIPAVLAVFLSAVPVALCCVVTDTVPELWCVLLWLGALILLLITHPVRLRDGAQGTKLTGILAIPVALAVTVLALALPADSYREPELELSDLEGWFTGKLPYVGQTSEGELVISFGEDLSDRVDLDDLPAGDRGRNPVLEVRASFSGALYLRGQDHDRYDGRSWSSSPEREETDWIPASEYIEANGLVSLRMLSRQSRYYFPYWPSQPVTLIGGSVENVDQTVEYYYTRMTLVEDWHALWTTQQKPDARPWEEVLTNDPYLELPEYTKEQAWGILDQILFTGDVVDRAKMIADFVRSSAEYDLNAPRMPEDAEDFAIWFLTEAESGYCSHFATATTVLLRAVGIPARYVEGYMTRVESGEPSIIRENMAHAWVEYYVDGLGWLILESTPGYGEDSTEETTAPTEETTAPTEETTEPTETTAPTEETTVPTEETTAPAETTVPGKTEPSGDGQQGSAPGSEVLLWMGILAAVMALVILQWLLRLRWRRVRKRRGKPNTRALTRFREAKRLARLSGLTLPEELVELADKACFSQYQLTQQELLRFDAYLCQAVAELKKAPFLLRLVYRLVFAAY